MCRVLLGVRHGSSSAEKWTSVSPNLAGAGLGARHVPAVLADEGRQGDHDAVDQGLTLVHIRAQLEQLVHVSTQLERLQDTFMSYVVLHDGQKSSS